MTWDELLSMDVASKYNGQVRTDIQCPQCGRYIYLDNTMILTSFPAKYRYWCSCGWTDCAHIKWTHNTM